MRIDEVGDGLIPRVIFLVILHLKLYRYFVRVESLGHPANLS